MRGIVLFFLLSGMLAACGNKEQTENKPDPQNTSDSKPLQIVTTIKPVQSIVMAIIGEKADSFQLIPDYSSPHSASFKPSDIRKVSQADIIFRIDENMEVMLTPLLEKHEKKLVSLAEMQGIELIDWSAYNKSKFEVVKQIIEETEHEGHDHEHEETAEEKPNEMHQDDHDKDDDKDHEEVVGENKQEENDHSHDHAKQDMHIWTSPKYAVLMAKKITQELSKLDPKNQPVYENNLSLFSSDVAQESMQISQQLYSKTHFPFIVFHNSWQYFSHEFGLTTPLVLNAQESISSGARKLSETRELISSQNIHCVFTDPNIAESRVDTLLSNLTVDEMKDIKVLEIDVLGRNIKPGPDAYLGWLKNMGKTVAECLQ